MTQEQLNEILELHERWADNIACGRSGSDYGGKRANFKNEIIGGLDFSDKDLQGANFKDSCLRYCDFRGTNLQDANLKGADIRGSNFYMASLSGANTENVLYNYKTLFFALQCPKEGSFIGYKRASDMIVKLLITEDAKRSSATGRKCRCSKAKVLSITTLTDEDVGVTSVRSSFNPDFIYSIGQEVSVSDFDEDRWNECSSGIHFFMDRNEAVMYK